MWTVSTTTRSWITLLCLMLCSSAEGTPRVVADMKIAVPLTRLVLEWADLAKISSGSSTSDMRARIRWRPRAQVVSRVNAIPPISSGNQPPSGTLVRFAAK